ncbi:hypothetical protein LXL04_027216 [Taraxacum kok-saghyz]
MSSLPAIKVYTNEKDPIWLAEAKWYDHKNWLSLISPACKNISLTLPYLDKKPQQAVPLADPTILKELGVQHISCNTGSTELLPYHVVVFKAAHVYYGDVLEMTDPRGFIEMAFLISLEGTKKYPTLTYHTVEMMSNLRKYALIPFLTLLSELVFPPMSNRVYHYSDVASNKEIGTALKMIKKEYPEVFSVIALINYVSVNGVDYREAYPRVLMYDKQLEHIINRVAKGDKGFEVLELSPHFRRRCTPRRSLNLEKSPSSPPGRKTVNARAYAEITMDDLTSPTNENSEKEQGGPSKKKQKNLGENENFLANIEKKITDQGKLIDELTRKLEKHDEIITILQAQISCKDHRMDNAATVNPQPSTAAVKKNQKPLEANDDESETSKLTEIIGILNQDVIEDSEIDDARVKIVDFLEKIKEHELAKTDLAVLADTFDCGDWRVKSCEIDEGGTPENYAPFRASKACIPPKSRYGRDQEESKVLYYYDREGAKDKPLRMSCLLSTQHISMSSLSEIKVYRNEKDPIWLAEAKWYDNNRWYPLISSARSNFGVDKLITLYEKKSQHAVPLADPTILKELGVQHISCNTGSTELLPYHVVVFKAAHVYYGDVLEMTDPRGFIETGPSLRQGGLGDRPGPQIYKGPKILPKGFSLRDKLEIWRQYEIGKISKNTSIAKSPIMPRSSAEKGPHSSSCPGPLISLKRPCIEMAFLISLEGTKKYPTLTYDMVEMMSNLRKYALTPFLALLSELVFPPMSNRVYNYSDVASNKEIGTALKMIKKEYPEVFSAIALINYVSINGVDSREAYPRVLMYDGNLEHLINSIAEGDKGFEVLELSPHFRRRCTPRRSLNTEKPPSSPPGRKTVNAKHDQSKAYAENSEKEQGGPSNKKQKNLGERTEASDTNGNFNIEKSLKKMEEMVKLQGTLISVLEKKVADLVKLADEIKQAQTSRKDYREDYAATFNRRPLTAAVKKKKMPLEIDDDESDFSTDED